MRLNRQILVDYLLVNPHDTIMISGYDGRTNRLSIAPDKELVVADQKLDSYSVNGPSIKRFFMLGDGLEAVEEFKLSDETVNKIMRWELRRMQTVELNNLLPAAKELVKHYDACIKIHMLKDLAFFLPNKGTVLITVDTILNDDQHVLKGYISVYQDHGTTIKYETVQAWRYESYDELNQLDEWKDLLRR